jgi:hypothetical protein
MDGAGADMAIAATTDIAAATTDIAADTQVDTAVDTRVADTEAELLRAPLTAVETKVDMPVAM